MFTMLKAVKSTKDIEILSEARKLEILCSKDSLEIKGTVYYVSNSGDDSNDGKKRPKPPGRHLIR